VNGLDLTDPILIGTLDGRCDGRVGGCRPSRPWGLVLEEPSRFREAPEISMGEAQEIARERLRESKALSIEERMEKHYDDGEHDPEHVRRLAASVDECT